MMCIRNLVLLLIIIIIGVSNTNNNIMPVAQANSGGDVPFQHDLSPPPSGRRSPFNRVSPPRSRSSRGRRPPAFTTTNTNNPTTTTTPTTPSN
uniref:Uncharacterized protein n=1 Tax=Cannabis sativa TaxID=3483 RepID=A0A803R7F5_CANSA